MRWFLAVCLAFSVSACASIPLKTMYNLWNFDPWSSDFREWRAGARLPMAGAAALKPRIKMSIATWRDGETQKTSDVFVLLPSSDPKDLAPLTTEMRAGYSLTAYRIDPKDYERLEKLRMRIVAAKTLSGPQIHGELKIEAGACGDQTALPKGPFPVSTYLLVERKDGYNPLIVDYDLTEAMKLAPPGEKRSAC